MGKSTGSQRYPRHDDYYLILQNTQQASRSYYLMVNFGPKRVVASRNAKTKYPHVNLDRKHYTPLFIKSRITSQDDRKYQDNFYKKLKRHQPNYKRMLRVFEPRTRYCHLCHKQYKNYQQHIVAYEHLQQLKKNSSFHQIREICERIREKARKKQSSDSYSAIADTNIKDELIPQYDSKQ